jgi:shikimate dehydrogenase
MTAAADPAARLSAAHSPAAHSPAAPPWHWVAAEPRRAAVLGSPIAHSLSPVLHRAAYAALGLDAWSYGAFEVDEAGLPGFVARLGAGLPEDGGPAWAGLSLTMPLKRVVIPLLDGVEPRALAVEAVNTLLFRPDGSRYGANTDIPGLAAALADRDVVSVPSAAVLGGGATAASTLAALAGIAEGATEVYVRSPHRAAGLEELAANLGLSLRVRPWDLAAEEAFGHALVVNTTPKGAADALAGAVPARPGTLFDVLYHPWPTPLAAAWERAGGRVLGGLDLLVHQAVFQVELMTGADPARRADLVAAMRAAGLAALAER